jgi:outer membrane lipoprotein SlyB
VHRWIAVVMMAAASAARAREGTMPCDKPAETLASAGDKVTFAECGAWIVNDKLLADITRQSEDRAELLKLLKARKDLADDVISIQAAALESAKKVAQINEVYYLKLKEKYQQVDNIAVESIENTREAIKLARSLRRTGYLTTSLVGGATGAYLGSQYGSGWRPAATGAAIGIAVGAAANWAILRLTGLD